MGEPHLDSPGEIRWFAGYGPAPVVGECPHPDCQHWGQQTIAYGPDFDHYTLVMCSDTEPGGCAGQCRGWFGEHPPSGRGQGTRYVPPERWLHVPRPE